MRKAEKQKLISVLLRCSGALYLENLEKMTVKTVRELREEIHVAIDVLAEEVGGEIK